MSSNKLQEKRQELETLAARVIGEDVPNRDELARLIVDSFCEITEPGYKRIIKNDPLNREPSDTNVPNKSTFDPELLNKSIQETLPKPGPLETIFYMNTDLSDTYSKKPGNIRLNWRKLLQKIPDMVLTGAGGASSPVLGFLAALSVFNGVWSLTKIDLTENHAVALYVMWVNRDTSQRISEQDALKKTNEYLNADGEDELNIQTFAEIINDLVRLKCIELTDGIVWLKERVQKTY